MARLAPATASPSLAPADNDEELFDVVSPENVPLTTATRSVCHRDGLLHRAAHVLLFRHSVVGGAEMLMQRRSSRKRVAPSCLDLSAAEHVSAGEGAVAASTRGLREELGLDVAAERLVEVRPPLVRRAVYPEVAVVDHEVVTLHALEWKGEDVDGKVVADEAEVAEVMWMKVGDVIAMGTEKPGELTPWLCEEMKLTDLAITAKLVLDCQVADVNL